MFNSLILSKPVSIWQFKYYFLESTNSQKWNKNKRIFIGLIIRKKNLTKNFKKNFRASTFRETVYWNWTRPEVIQVKKQNRSLISARFRVDHVLEMFSDFWLNIHLKITNLGPDLNDALYWSVQ